MKRSVPILLYHHVAPEREITPQGFEAQLKDLLKQGYLALTMDEVIQVVQGKKEIDRPAFSLTFDDGYSNNWAHAFPILKKLSIPATIYLVTGQMGSEGFMTWDQAKEMSASSLVTFGSHTETHRHFIRREKYSDLEGELKRSKLLIEERIGKACRHFAWPWGDYESEWLALVEKCGYDTAVTTRSGANADGTSPYELHRINIRRENVDWLKARLRWNEFAFPANAFGLFYGWDRRFKVWWNSESPYSHG